MRNGWEWTTVVVAHLKRSRADLRPLRVEQHCTHDLRIYLGLRYDNHACQPRAWRREASGKPAAAEPSRWGILAEKPKLTWRRLSSVACREPRGAKSTSDQAQTGAAGTSADICLSGPTTPGGIRVTRARS